MNFIYEPGEPTLVMLHGTGGDEREMLEFGKQLRPGVGYLSVRGNEPERGMNRFFRRMAEGVFDEPNLKMRTEELASFVIEKVPTGKRIAVGFSNGANIAAAALLLRPEAFDGAALLAAMVPLTPDALPELSGKEILLVSGRQDPMVPMENANRLAAMLRDSGAIVDHFVHGGGHGLDQASFTKTADWLAAR